MSGYNIKGRDGDEYYDIFNDEYFVAGGSSFSIHSNTWKKSGGKIIEISNKLTTNRVNAKYKATTNSKFKNEGNDIFGTSNLIAKYEIYTESKLYKMVGSFPNIKLEDDSVIVNNMYNRILIVAIGGGGGGERGTADSRGSPGGTGATVASFLNINFSRLKITIGAGGAGGTGSSGANGHSGGTTIVKDNNNETLVQASGGGGAAGGTPGAIYSGANGFQDLDYIVDGNPGRRGAGGAGGGKYNAGPFYESGRNGSYGKNGVVYIYYFH
jgi:hypothetical protein